MPSREIDGHGVEGVAAFASLLAELLDRAETAKGKALIEPVLTKTEFGDVSTRLAELFADYPPLDIDADSTRKSRQFAIIETAIRDLFGSLIVSRSHPR
jgi:hypothetical protein